MDEAVIDLMVALTYPKRFVVERRGGGSQRRPASRPAAGWFDPLMLADDGRLRRLLLAVRLRLSQLLQHVRTCWVITAFGYGYYGYNNYYNNGWVNVGVPPGTAAAA